MGYNYGAKEYRRVRSGIKFTSITGFILLAAIWIFLLAFPEFFISIFNDDPALVSATIPAIHLYFFGFFMMALQMAGNLPPYPSENRSKPSFSRCSARHLS